MFEFISKYLQSGEYYREKEIIDTLFFLWGVFPFLYKYLSVVSICKSKSTTHALLDALECCSFENTIP